MHHLEAAAASLVPHFIQRGCKMFSASNMQLMLDEVKASSSAGSFFLGAIEAFTAQHLRADAAAARECWREFMDGALSAGGAWPMRSASRLQGRPPR